MRTRVARFGLASLLVAASIALVGRPTEAAPGEDRTPAANPDLKAACGLDILVILDESGSIHDFGAIDPVRQAVTSFTSALQNTGSRMAIAEFNYQGRLVTDYTEVTTASKANLFDPYVNNTGGTSGEGYNPTPGQRTNWEDGFRVGRYFLPPPGGRPHLTVFITDGLPNNVDKVGNHGNGAHVTYDPGNPVEAQNEYELKVPLDQNETQTAREGSGAAQPAIPNANALKAAGSHVLAVAVGQGLNKPGTLDTLQLVSGPDVYTGAGDFDIQTDDVFRVDAFDELEAALRGAAFQLCAPSVNVEKLVDTTPDPGTDDAVPAAGWTMTADVAHPSGFDWVSPAGATGGSADVVTNAGGFANFQWTPNGAGPSTITVTEDDTPGTGFANDVTETDCQYRTPDQPSDQPLQLTASGDGFFSAEVPEQSIVTCTFLNRALPEPSIDLEKSTDGADADTAPGPSIPVGAPVTWTYRVTNTGNVTLDFTIDDVPAQTIDCGGTTSLAPNDTIDCTATGTAALGAYENTAIVTATPPPSLGLPPVTDTDTSHHNGVQPGIDVEKSTNGVDADNAPGVFVDVGADVTWEYVVTNTGPVVIDDVALVDDQLGAITCPQTTLQPSGQAGDTTTCTGPTQPAQPGQYSNLATVTGDATGTPVSDSDPSHYFGQTAAIDLEKSTNGEDADNPTGPTVAVGDTVAWTYVITNTGNIPLVDWTLLDDQIPSNAIACPQVGIIAPGQVITCIAFGTATVGQYANLATVSAGSTGGIPVTDADPSHYLGVDAVLDLEKSTNGQDADAAPGVFIEVGDPVTWTYEVSMNGTDQVADVAVQDLPSQSISPVEAGGFNVGDTNQDNLLEQGETWQFTASGAATAGLYTNLAAATGTGVITGPLFAYDPSNYFGVTGGIDVEKSTNGVDADDPADAPLIAVGDPVDWNYRVLNTANSALSNVVVTDDQGVAVTCPSTTLAVGAFMDCTATGTATVQGLYTNVATATGIDAAQVNQTDTDPSHYQGYVSEIIVEKSTNGVDADAPTGPFVVVGDTVTWTYEVTSGDLPVRNVVLTDDQGVTPVFVDGDANGNDEIDPGETWTYEATGTAVAGQYANLATATGVDTQETPLTDDDPSHYYGIQFQANVQTTATNLAGDDHLFAIEVRYDDGTNVVEAPNGTEVEFTWTGDGAVTAVNGTDAPGATTCVTVASFCFVTVSSPAPGSGTISVESVTATIGGSSATGTTTSTPPGLVATTGGSLTADKTWVELLADVQTTATNVAGQPHTFTIEAFVDSGSGPALAPDGTTIAFTWTGAGAVTQVNGANDPDATSCVTVGPFCTVTVASDVPGGGTITIDSITATFGASQVTDDSLTTTTDGSLTAAKTWIVFEATVQTTATNLVGDDHTFTIEAFVDDGSGPDPGIAPNGTVVVFTWTGDGAVTTVDGAPAPGATSCVTVGPFCTVTVSSATPGSGMLEVTSVTADIGGSTLTGDTTTAPAGLVATSNGSLAADKTWIVFQANVVFSATNLAGDEHVFSIDAVYENGGGQQVVPDGSTVEFTWTGGGQVTETNGTPDADANSCETTGGACTVTVDAATPTSGTIEITAVTATVGGSQLTGDATTTPPSLVADPATVDASLTAGKTWVEFIAKASFTSTNLAGDAHVFTLDAVYENGGGQQIVPDGTTVTFTWTGDGQVTETNGAPDLDATTCATTGGSCSVTVESATPGGGTIEITAVTADLGSGPLTGLTITSPPTLLPEAGSALTAAKTWVAFDVDITPLQAENPVGDPHTFTISVQVDDGAGLTPLSIPSESGTVVWSWAAPDGTTSTGTCTLIDGGTCEVVQNSAVGGPGTLTATALDVVYGGVTLPTVDLTASGPGQAAELSIPTEANKFWFGYSLVLDPPLALNLWPADPDHVVTLTLDADPEDPQFAPIAGQAVDVTLTSTVATITDVSDGTFSATTATCITDANGECEVTVTSTGPGGATLSAIYNHTYQGQDSPISGNDAEKTWRAYRINVTPPDATNLLGDPHTFEVLVESSDDGTSWSPVVDARPSLGLTAPGSIESQTCSSGTGGDGRCTVVVTSTRPGSTTLTASYVARVGGGSATYADTGTKTWIDYRIGLTPGRAVNEVGDPHVFIALLEVNRGSGFVPAAGVIVNVASNGVGSITAATPTGPRGGTCRTNGIGRCTVTVSSNTAGSLTLSARFDATVGGTTRSYPATAVKIWETPPQPPTRNTVSPNLPATGGSPRNTLAAAALLLALGVLAFAVSRRRTPS